MNDRVEHQVLVRVLSELPVGTIEELKRKLADVIEHYLCLIEAIDEVQNGEITASSLRKEWVTLSRNGGKRFGDLMKLYIDRFQSTERAAGRKGSLSELETSVSNHSKWHRMMHSRGFGKQYHDDMRRVCFVFQLSYLESLELLWAAGQPFDPEDPRDFVIARCLANNEYSFEKVDQALSEIHCAALFSEQK